MTVTLHPIPSRLNGYPVVAAFRVGITNYAAVVVDRGAGHPERYVVGSIDSTPALGTGDCWIRGTYCASLTEALGEALRRADMQLDVAVVEGELKGRIEELELELSTVAGECDDLRDQVLELEDQLEAQGPEEDDGGWTHHGCLAPGREQG